MPETGAECGADENMYVHRDQRRNSQPKPFHQSTEFPLLPPRPRSSGDTGFSSRFELPGLQVRGFCCPLQQRPCKGRLTHRVTPNSRGGGEGSLTLLNREEPASRSRTGTSPEITSGSGASSVCSQRESVREAAGELSETPAAPRVQQPALHTRPGATKMSELHLYLPSSLCDDEEQDAETAEMRTTAEDTHDAHPVVCSSPPRLSQDETATGPALHPTTSENITEEDLEHS